MGRLREEKCDTRQGRREDLQWENAVLDEPRIAEIRHPPVPQRWYPQGKVQDYKRKKYQDGYIVDVHERGTAEARERERLESNMYNTIRKAAEVLPVRPRTRSATMI